MTTYTSGMLPGYAMRALHSSYVDALLGLQPADALWRDALLGRCNGATFEALTLALLDGRMLVTHRTDDAGHLWLGIGVPSTAGPVRLCEISESHHGITAAEFVGLTMHDIDAELAAMLGGEGA